jgi:hypothetical protein
MLPEIEAGAVGTDRTVIDRAVLVKQPVPDFTVTDPEVKGLGKVTEIVFVP